MTMTKNNIAHKLTRVYEFVTLLTVEPFIFVFFFIYTLKQVPNEQLIQDKICMFTFKLSANYCVELPHMTDDDDYLGKKSEILAEATTFKLIHVVFLALPSLIAAFFVGSWTDKYLKAKKILLICGAIAAVCESLLLIINVYFFSASQYFILFSLVPVACSGGLLSLLTCFWAYVASTTPPHLRVMRMAVLEVITCTAKPLGMYLAGQILNTPAMMSGDQLHNYTAIYIICGVSYFLALVWTLWRVDEERDIVEFDRRFGQTDSENGNKETTVSDKLKRYEEYKDIRPIRLLFNTDNIKAMYRTLVMPREGTLRLQIWLLLVSLSCYLLSHVGPIIFLYQFAQKVYKWNSETFSTATAIGYVINAGATLLLAPILIKVLKMRDMDISTIGLISYLAQNIICGIFLEERGFFVSLAAGCLGSVASIGIRSYFSKIIMTKELGKVFSLLSAIESLMPLIAAAFFTQVFNNTMDTIPGLSFIVVAVLLIIPIVVANWIRFCTKMPNTIETVIKTDNNLMDSNDTTV